MNGYVYFIRAVGFSLCKIGRTARSPNERMRQLATGSPHPLELLGFLPTVDPAEAERRIHRELSQYREHREWFALEPEVLADFMARWKVETDIAMESANFDLIQGRFLVLRSKVQRDQISVVTEKCPFCGERHSHGSGGLDWRENIQVVDGISTLGHRVNHCVVRGVRLRLPSGKVVCNDDGYFLGVSV